MNRRKPAELYTHTHTHTHTGNLLIAFLSTIFIVSGAFADPDIDTATASCDDGVFNSNTGPVNIEVNWEPNEINLHWYNNNTLIENVSTESSSCTYDSTLTPLQTIPTRTGYTFAGWRVRPTYDFSTLDISQNGLERWSITESLGKDRCYHSFDDNNSVNVKCTAYAELGELKRQEWKVHFNYGDLYGSGYCSAKVGEHDSSWGNVSSNWLATYDELQSASGENGYCWCQATGYKPRGENIVYGPEAVSFGSIWVFTDYHSSSYCHVFCAETCAKNATTKIHFRRVLFGVSQ